MNSVRSNNLSLKYQRYHRVAKKTGIRKFKFVTKTRFLLSHGFRETTNFKIYIEVQGIKNEGRRQSYQGI